MSGRSQAKSKALPKARTSCDTEYTRAVDITTTRKRRQNSQGKKHRQWIQASKISELLTSIERPFNQVSNIFQSTHWCGPVPIIVGLRALPSPSQLKVDTAVSALHMADIRSISIQWSVVCGRVSKTLTEGTKQLAEEHNWLTDMCCPFHLVWLRQIWKVMISIWPVSYLLLCPFC